MGCDGKHAQRDLFANRINPIVQPWLAALPTPTSGGPLNNFLAPPIPDTILGDSDYYMWRIDEQFGTNHVFASFWHQRAPAKFYSQLPQPIATETYSDPQNSWVNRMNYDKIISNTIVNHAAMGYLNRNEGYGCVNQDFVDQFPQIGGVAGHNVPPQIGMGELQSDGVQRGRQPRERHDAADLHRQRCRDLDEGRRTPSSSAWNGARSWGTSTPTATRRERSTSATGATGIVGVNSGNPVASFLLGAADSANVDYRSVPSNYARQHAWILHAGDSWRLNNKLTLDYGLRWDYYSPSSEKYDQMSFFDPVGANPGAGGRPGRLAFSGDSYGAASYGATYPEKDWYGGLAPRVGAVYALNDKTVIRGGWGIFYTQAFYPGWGGGMSLDGFANDADRERDGRRHRAGHVPGSGLPNPELLAATRHPVRLQERAGHLLPQHRRQQASVHAPVEHHDGSRARSSLRTERGLRGIGRPPDAVEHGSAECHRSEVPLARQQAE